MSLRKIFLLLMAPTFIFAMKPPRNAPLTWPPDVLRYLAPFILQSSARGSDILAIASTSKLFHKEINNPAAMLAALRCKFAQPVYPYDWVQAIERLQKAKIALPIIQNTGILACIAATKKRVEDANELCKAIKYSHTEAIINHLHIKSVLNLQAKESGYTPLMYAVNDNSVSQLRIIAHLINTGADPDIQNSEGETALYMACRLASSEIIAQLLVGRANPNVKNNAGRTALMLTVHLKRFENAIMLIDCGADLDAQDYGGRTAYDYAVAYHNDAMVALIETARKKRKQTYIISQLPL
jgi:hypothetical protein